MEAVVVTPPEFACVVAADEERGIGKDDDLPWPRLPGDLAHFKNLTSQTRAPGRRNAVIMGRRTWDSVPPRFRPLPNRLNVVVSRGEPDLPPEVVLARGLDSAVDAAMAASVETIFVIGGGVVFSDAIRDPRCQTVYYTRIDAAFDCDVFFPVFEDGFVLETTEPRREAGITYAIERWRRRA